MASVRVEIDTNICVGSGMCEAIAPAAFRVEDGIAVLISTDGTDLETLREAEDNCPTGAIVVSDDEGE
jgi:ferredoxin